jgi:hypothetical protein
VAIGGVAFACGAVAGACNAGGAAAVARLALRVENWATSAATPISAKVPAMTP